MLSLSRVKKVILFLVIVVAVGSFIQFAYANPAPAKDAAKKINAHAKVVKAPLSKDTSGLVFIAAAICVGFSSLAAGWAVSTVGAAAMGAISEKPELAGRALIFVGLAEGIAIYGLIVAIMLLGKV